MDTFSTILTRNLSYKNGEYIFYGNSTGGLNPNYNYTLTLDTSGNVIGQKVLKNFPGTNNFLAPAKDSGFLWVTSSDSNYSQIVKMDDSFSKIIWVKKIKAPEKLTPFLKGDSSIVKGIKQMKNEDLCIIYGGDSTTYFSRYNSDGDQL